MADCKLDEKGGTYCSVHRCGFGEPCLKPGCPHCQEKPNTRHARLARKLLNAQAKVERWEKRVGLALGRLTDARAELARLRRRVRKIDPTVDVTDTEGMKEIAEEDEVTEIDEVIHDTVEITGNGEPVVDPFAQHPEGAIMLEVVDGEVQS